ncbi:MAG TPA: AI-2E family transporter [Candidatus Limnocylindrales bacterium]|jgi:predicted PurR-regulated permease PerM
MEDIRRLVDRLTQRRRASQGPPPEATGDGPEDGVVVGTDSTPAISRPDRDRGPFLWLVIAAIFVLWIARDVLGPFVVAAVTAYAFSPLVTAAERRTGWPRPVVVGIGYAIAVAVLAVLAYFLAGRIAQEIALLAASGPDSLATLLRQLIGRDTLDVAGQQISVADIAREIQSRVGGLIASPGDAAHLAGEVGSIGLELILALIVTFYFLVDGRMLRDRSIALLPVEHRARTVEVLGRIHDVLGKWLRGQLALIVLVATVVYVALGPVLHLPYALGIAILTGVLEIIPLIGPLIATAIAGVDAFARGGAELALVVVVLYFVIRQVEDQVVMPIVIGRAVHLHPVVTIFAVLVGLSVYGVLGGLLGVPVAAAVNVIFRELYPTAEHAAASPDAARTVESTV